MALPLFAPLARLVTRRLLGSAMSAVLGPNDIGAVALQIGVHLDEKKFRSLQRRAKRAVIIGANRAAKPIRLAVINNAQGIARFGFTAKSIGTKTRVYGEKAVVSVIGPKMSYSRVKGKYTQGERAGQARRHVPYLYSWIVEKGSYRSRRKPFLMPAWDQYGDRYPARVAAEVAVEIRKLLTK